MEQLSEKFSPSSIIQKEIVNTLIEEEFEHNTGYWAPRPHVYHASQIGSCLRSQYLKAIMPVKDEEVEGFVSSMLNKRFGRLIHDDLEELLERVPPNEIDVVGKEVEVKLDFGDAVVVGRIDMLVKVKGEKVVLEYKTTGHAPEVPYPAHVYQVQAYMNAVDAKYASIQYFSKSWGGIRGFDVEYDPKFLDMIKERVMALEEAFAKGEAPPRPPIPMEECNWCVYRKMCWGDKIESD